ncbi:MAG TPA: hypothetical protein VK327_03975, partial [Candidatus Paceibacterota bacterium]|nr:hypothetical protein [Candidatus Paceibacterota bacterium]
MSANPFAVPNAAAIEQNLARRERVKITVYTVLGCLVALCLGLLFQGCMHHEAAAENPMKDVENAASATAPTATTPPVRQTNAPTAEVPAIPMKSPAQPTKTPAAPMPAPQAETLYVIKSG